MTRRLLPIRTVLEDQDWLGSLAGRPSFRGMRVLLIAAMAEPLNAEELQIFTSVTGRSEPPQAPVEELWIIAGRRSGKLLGIAVLAAYLSACVDYRAVLSNGERGVCPVMAGSVQQANQIFNFLRDIFTGIPKCSGAPQVVVRRKDKSGYNAWSKKYGVVGGGIVLFDAIYCT
jgi:hypothetical protein